MEHLCDSVSVGDVRHCGEHRREEHDVREGDSHTAAHERVVHVPRVAEEDDALLV